MVERTLVLNLARVLIAVAWTDGELSHAERNALKDVLFHVPELSGDEWGRLEMYLDAPVDEAERDQLIARLLGSIRTDGDKQFVMAAMRAMIEADGTIHPAEQRLLDELGEKMDTRATGLVGLFSRLLRDAVGRSSETSGEGRETRYDDYIRNTVFYELERKMERKGQHLTLPEAEVRKICLAAGLMAWVAGSDQEVSEPEKAAIETALGEQWGLPVEKARMVAEISADRALKGLRLQRLCREFFERTTYRERCDFFRVLFQVANARGRTSYEEINLIQRLHRMLKIDRRDFIAAKMTISREDRGGM